MCSLEKPISGHVGAAPTSSDGSLPAAMARKLLPFRGFIREFAPLERSQRQQGASSLGVGEIGKPIALRRFAQAIFTGFHLPPKAEIQAVAAARSHANPAPWPYLVWLAPAVPEAGVALDLVEGRVEARNLFRIRLITDRTFAR